MTEAEWLAGDDPKSMVEFLRPAVSDRKLRLFACGLCRRLKPLVGTSEYARGLEAAEAYAGGAKMKSAMGRHRQALTNRRIALSGPDPSDEYTALFLCTVALSEKDFRAFPTCVADLKDNEHGELLTSVLRSAAPAVRDVFGNPFRPATIDLSWLTSTVVALAKGIYADRAFDRMPILADALQDAGCDNADILAHCRGPDRTSAAAGWSTWCWASRDACCVDHAFRSVWTVWRLTPTRAAIFRRLSPSPFNRFTSTRRAGAGSRPTCRATSGGPGSGTGTTTRTGSY
ncbi:Uncharacterized protein OS=uncultured bacterium PE=4 SV=1 [Gemmataceae bacterium]|nr:Uncharacterized protein OS=uncultured bacterium PE=4 SV=1 [Gemmataceae bacterium]VTT97608.1 Uncharacterized protein OS=uncultured bacterium PE=4 SV=1 [Gemmataceae bacterium]